MQYHSYLIHVGFLNGPAGNKFLTIPSPVLKQAIFKL